MKKYYRKTEIVEKYLSITKKIVKNHNGSLIIDSMIIGNMKNGETKYFYLDEYGTVSCGDGEHTWKREPDKKKGETCITFVITCISENRYFL